jgi:hypothetical protein
MKVESKEDRIEKMWRREKKEESGGSKNRSRDVARVNKSKK